MRASFDVCGIGNAIVDVLAPCDDAFLTANGVAKGAMNLVDAERSAVLYARMNPMAEASGGSAANTMAGFSALGGKAAYLGKVAADEAGALFARDLRSIGVSFSVPPLVGGEPTARSLIFVTPDAQRSMNTFLGASSLFSEADIDEETVQAARLTYLEGYLFDRPEAQKAFRKAAALAHKAGRKIALTLSDSFCVERHRDAFRALVRDEVDILFSNEGELTALYQASSLQEAVAAARGECGLVVATQGAKGAMVARSTEITMVPCTPVEPVVDTTGAGDLFAAGFLFGLTRRLSMGNCAHLGHMAAAEVISHYGPRPEADLKILAADLTAKRRRFRLPFRRVKKIA